MTGTPHAILFLPIEKKKKKKTFQGKRQFSRKKILKKEKKMDRRNDGVRDFVKFS